jgi:hypothetical protein
MLPSVQLPYNGSRAAQRRPQGVAAASGSADARMDGPGRSVVVPASAARENASGGASGADWSGASASFITQLAVLHIGGGDRRSRRTPDLVTDRANRAYHTGSRLGSEILPGFLVSRDV